MINITKAPHQFCFVGNPIVYEAEVDSSQIEMNISVADTSKKFALLANKKISENKWLLTIDVSSIIEALLPNEEYLLDENVIVNKLTNFSHSCILSFSIGDINVTSDITVFRGGVSNKVYSELSALGKNIFSYRLSNAYQQFLFTTRTHSRHLLLREEELFPFVFIYPQGKLSFKNKDGEVIPTHDILPGEVCSMSITAIQKKFIELYDKPVDFIQVCVDSVVCFDITIKSSLLTEEKYKIKFKNSLGAYEVITAFGKAEDTPEFQDEVLYNSLNENLFFEEFRERVLRRDVLILEVGYKHKDELHFIKDLIASDDIYIVDENSSSRCLITVDDMKIARRMVKPTSVELSVRLVNDERYYSAPFVDLGEDPIKPDDDNKLPNYIKQPLEYRYIVLNPDIASVNGEGYNVLSKDWDKPEEAFGLGGENKKTYPVRRIGEYEWTLENWQMCYNAGRNYKDYIVDQAVLDASDIPMTEAESNTKNGCYTFGGSATTRLFTGLEFYSKKYETESVNRNLLDRSKISNFNVVNNTIVEDPNSRSFYIDGIPAWALYTMSRSSKTSTFKIYRFWDVIKVGNNNIINVYETSDKDILSITDGSSYPLAILFVFDDANTPINELPDIKIELGSVATPFIEYKDDLKLSGWKVPSKEDFMQLLGMLGTDLSISNVMKHLFVSPDDTEIPWINSFLTANESKDLLGTRLIPCGHKRNTTLENGGKIYQFGQRMAYGLEGEGEISPVIYFNTAGSIIPGQIVYDDYYNIPIESASIKAWQRNYRFCRALTNKELGYRLWIDEANDKILVTTLTDAQPINTTELEKGLLRGLAVRWLNEDKTKVLTSLSKLQPEVSKTRNNGDYGWYGFNE